MTSKVKLGKYRHYKGKDYELVNVARHSETMEEMAVYYDDKKELWVRPLKMFLEDVKVDGKMVPRFMLIRD